MTSRWSLVKLENVLTHYQEYIGSPEARLYPKLSVKLYGKGVALDPPADGTTLRMKRHQVAKAGQVILSEIWGKKGAIGLVPSDGEGALCTSHFFLFNVREDKAVSKWLDYIFRANYLEPQLGAEAKGTTGYAAVRPKMLLDATIPLPPLTEQQRIVSQIDGIHADIRDANKLREQASNETRLLWQNSLRATMDRSQWPLVALQGVCSAIIDNLHSNPQYADTGVPCIRSPDVGWGKLKLETALMTDEAEYRRRTVRGEPQPDDIVLVREGGGTGKAAIVEPGQRFSLGQRVMMLRPDKKLVLPKFFLYQILSPLIQDDHIVPLSKGSAAPHLNIGSLRRFPFRLPSLADQCRMVDELEELQAELEALKLLQAETDTELSALLPSILSRAFAGEL